MWEHKDRTHTRCVFCGYALKRLLERETNRKKEEKREKTRVEFSGAPCSDTWKLKTSCVQSSGKESRLPIIAEPNGQRDVFQSTTMLLLPVTHDLCSTDNSQYSRWTKSASRRLGLGVYIKTRTHRVSSIDSRGLFVQLWLLA